MLQHGDSCEHYSLCTDDKHIEDIMREGHINFAVKKAISLGVEPIDAIKMATINTARHYGLRDLGAIAPGYQADIIVLDDLKNMNVRDVFYNGKKIKWTVPDKVTCNPALKSTVHLGNFSAEKLRMKVDGECSVIQVQPKQIYNRHIKAQLPAQDGQFVPNSDFNKVAVVERYGQTGDCGVCAVRGFGMTGGAIATSFSHDSHNIIVVGDNDDDMVLAVRAIEDLQGGYVITGGGKILHSLPLPVMGLMSEAGHEAVSSDLFAMLKIAHEHGVSRDIDPFFTLSFFALPVIPELRITPAGLFDVLDNEFVNL